MTVAGGFFSGQESDAYINDTANIEIYDVNTIANYDPDIIPFLDAPYGMEFMREEKTSRFVHAPSLAFDLRMLWRRVTSPFRR